MSLQLINHSPDLTRLRNEGYDIEVTKGHLIVHDVPYVNSDKKVLCGKLVSTLKVTVDKTEKPDTHVAYWVGEHPCDSNGSKLTSLVNGESKQTIREGLQTSYSFSQKPPIGFYDDYYAKMTQYILIMGGHANVIDQNATAKTFPVITAPEEESIFCYIDNASSRSGITFINDKLSKHRVAIIGLGGTGSYILDLVAKTPVAEIHLFDGDIFHQHNAFRAPGAPSVEDLKKKQMKVEWFVQNYSRMRRHIVAHPKNIDQNSVTELNTMDFVFLALDKGKPRRIIVDFLVEKNISFIDVGMGLYIGDDNDIGGSVKVLTCTLSNHDHVKKKMNFVDGDDVYADNIQVADINALNAALAVIKWKKLFGFYIDANKENYALYQISDNEIDNEVALNEAKIDQA